MLSSRLASWAMAALLAATPAMAARHAQIMCQPVVPATGYKGIYVATAQIGSVGYTPLQSSTYSLSYIDGVAIRAIWSAIEPSNGGYSWDALDSVVSQAVAAGKKVSIAIGAGRNTPGWVFTAGAQAVNMNFAGTGATCSAITEPAPWDATYQAAFNSMLQALAAHLTATGALSSVSVVKFTGINQITEELVMSHSALNPPACDNATAQWQAAGYTPAKVIAAFQSLEADTAAAFPGKVYAVVLRGNEFPYIDNSGNIIQGPNSPGYVDIQAAIMSTGLAPYFPAAGGLFDALAMDSLSAMLFVAEGAGSHGGIAFYQTNFFGGPSIGSECGYQFHGGGGFPTICNETYTIACSKTADAFAEATSRCGSRTPWPFRTP